MSVQTAEVHTLSEEELQELYLARTRDINARNAVLGQDLLKQMYPTLQLSKLIDEVINDFKQT